MPEITFIDVHSRKQVFNNDIHVFGCLLVDDEEVLAYRKPKTGYIPTIRLSMKRFNAIRPQLEFLLTNYGYNFYRLKQ